MAAVKQHRRELALAHLYPKLAGIPEPERRQVLLDTAGVYSSKQLTQADFELVMARYEALLWQRVDAHLCPDPRLCRRCARPLTRLKDNRGQCPELCETRKVYAWTRDYWAKKVPARGAAHSRHKFKLRQLWTLLKDYLPESERNSIYLAGIVAKAVHVPVRDLLENDMFAWHTLTLAQCNNAIEAIKDRLHHAVPHTAA